LLKLRRDDETRLLAASSLLQTAERLSAQLDDILALLESAQECC
jgi:hypothetical protein